MSNLERDLADAEYGLAAAEREVYFAERDQEQLDKYAWSNTWNQRYATEEEMKADSIRVGRAYRDALVKKQDAQRLVQSLKTEIAKEKEKQLAVEAEKRAAMEARQQAIMEAKKKLEVEAAKKLSAGLESVPESAPGFAVEFDEL